MPEEKQTRKQRRDNATEAKMTHLLSYKGPRGQEARLHDAEFRGEHYFDFRFYEGGKEGVVPTRRGIRIGAKFVEHLEEAITRWKEFVRQVKDTETEGSLKTAFVEHG